ncbi:MAG TPA: NfeD family protein [Verrucomicrobiae bacterium]|nr:NfeD family protein [Verrucomicrobiae bacterium]
MATVVTLILVGAALLLLETVLPGMIAGIAGFGCLVAGVVVAYLNFDVRTANLVFLAVVVGLTAGALCWFKFFPQSRLAKLFISQRTVGDIGTEKPELLHQTGTAFTSLRPSGTAVINGKRIDVVTEGPFVERGSPIKVVEVEGARVVVRAV